MALRKLALLVALGGVFIAWLFVAAAQETSQASSLARTAAVKPAVPEKHRRVAPVSMEASAPGTESARSVPQDAAVANSNRPGPSREVQTLEEEIRSFDHHFERLDEQRMAEGIDEEWSKTFSNAVQDGMQAFKAEREQFKDSRIVSIACGKTLCRVDTLHTSHGSARRCIAALARTLGPWVDSTTAYVDRSGLRTSFYFSREGFDLPNRHHWEESR